MLYTLDNYLQNAIAQKASDIHVEPQATKFIVRYRIDGILHLAGEGPTESHTSLVSSIKVLAKLDIAEVRKPQDGHIFKMIEVLDPATQVAKSIDLDIRVSTFPTIFGEAVTMRLLNRSESLYERFELMGISTEDSQHLLDAIHKPHGMILTTGPAGSGKTTMLYTAMNQIRSSERNIITLEDPVEYQVEGLRQAQINPEIGFTFSAGLRSILRQDPDVIMIGEVRDVETAEVAIRAALTGRLLFATMHTNDSVTAIMRFLEFGIPRSSIVNALRVVIAQRLIRLNCTHCLEDYVPVVKVLEEAGIKQPVPTVFKRGKGCDACGASGYLGRQGVHEMLFIDHDIEQLIISEVSYQKLWEAARIKGLKTLRELALQLALQGKTTLEEATHSTA